MTVLLASVFSPAEAAIVLAEGVDAIEAAGATPAETAAILAAGGQNPAKVQLYARAGGIGPGLRDRCRILAAAGAQALTIDLNGAPDDLASLAELAKEFRLVCRIGEGERSPEAISALGAAGVAGAMASVRTSEALLDTASLAAIAAYLDACRANGLLAGLAGGIEAPDVPRLLRLAPDVIGFPSGLVGPAHAAEKLRVVRAMIPKQTTAPAQAATAHGFDQVFVRDFVLSARVGAYASERGKLQRVRFNVTLDIDRIDRPVATMDDVFSYDLITDGVAAIVASEHTLFVEVLAERIAAAMLAYPRVASARVRVEKLDLREGSAGVEIVRQRG